MNFKNQSFFQSVKNACRGIHTAFKSERNIKIQTLLMIAIVVVGIVLNFSHMEWVIIILASMVVLGIEMINTAIEYTIDMICNKQFHPIAKRTKDISAGAVLIASLGALVIGSIIVLPKIIK